MTLHCEVHEKMRRDRPRPGDAGLQKTDSEGRYRLEHLPLGRYVLTAWISEKDVRTQAIELKANTTQRVDFPVK